MKYFVQISLLLILFISSCKQRVQPLSPEKLFEKYRKAVVLIRNTFYYEVRLSNGTKLYFNSFENGEFKGLTLDIEEIQSNPNVVYGTGFFISNDGLIATNNHVTYPPIDKSIVRNNIHDKLRSIDSKITNDKYQVENYIYDIKTYIAKNYNILEYETIATLNQIKDSLENEKSNLENYEGIVNFDPLQTTIECKVQYIGIAYDNTFVNRISDFIECVVVKFSKETEIDLALIQLKDKTTPSNVKTWFDFNNHNSNITNGTLETGEDTSFLNKLKIDTKLYMIGFNHGIELAKTSEGIKAQLTQGTVSQESDQIKVLYSIPSLSGSSGSPVIDQWGNLVAINFAKVTNSQSFNYGILSKHLKALKEQQ